MLPVLTGIAGFIFGLGLGLILLWLRRLDSLRMTEQLMHTREQEVGQLTQQLKDAFGALSLDALSRNTEEFLKLAGENLEKRMQAGSHDLSSKKELIDQTLKTMKSELDKVQSMVQTLEKDRKAKFDVLASQLTSTAEETKQLRETAHALKAALTNSQVRGQWGERMAEDVLRLAGFQEGINYLKQQSSGVGRPDYTFYLPQKRIVHMDVKFPLDNYLNYMEATTDTERQSFLTQFLRDARRRVDEVTKRDYINLTEDTLDYVLVFIPNEQVYTFLNEQDRSLIDMALGKKVILCSPVTLYAILAVIRQAVDNFHLERTASEIMTLLQKFYSQWDKFVEAIEKVGRKLEESNKAYQELNTTRRNQLERPLREIDALQKSDKFFETATGQRIHVIESAEKESAE